MKKNMATVRYSSMHVNVMYTFLILFILLLITIYKVSSSFAVLTPVKSIEIFSEKLNYNVKNPGAWKVIKTAKWTGKGEAEITFDVESIKKIKNKNIDVLFITDISASMDGDKIERVKSDSIELIEKILATEGNKVGLITFGTESEIISPFISNKNELIEMINNLTTSGLTNYYQALLNADKVLNNYNYDAERECVILFLTDGYPTENSPNEVGQYSNLKKKYPYLTINAIQYEMGKDILDPIKNISDNQYFADMNTLNNVLFDASSILDSYDLFKLTDFINSDYFYVNSSSDIKVSHGKIIFSKDSQKIDWTIDNCKTGSKYEMTLKVKLKSNIETVDGLFPTNKKEEVRIKIGEIEESIVTDKTPILSDKYKVIYDANAPDGCMATEVPVSMSSSVFERVEISEDKPKCEGYQFKGWKLTTPGVAKLNNDYFMMPGFDVELKAIWSKVNVKKLMDGTVSTGLTLYKQVQEDMNISSKYVKKYEGDTSTFNGSQDVYYYYHRAANNNVVFASYCWKIVRTTSTGGVKLIYNGLPSSTGECNNTGTASQLTAAQMNESSNTITFNYYYNSAADVGYMYNTRYTTKAANLTTAQINAMLYNDDVNKSSSKIKTAIDYWYSNNMTKYTSYLEDHVWCNNRYNIGKDKYSLDFYSHSNKNLSCQNKNDRFTVSEENGNGNLTYPVGLITEAERVMAFVSSSSGQESPLASGSYYWTMSPFWFNVTQADVAHVASTGTQSVGLMHNNPKWGVRPAISLRAGIEYSTGNGSSTEPYVILAG